MTSLAELFNRLSPVPPSRQVILDDDRLRDFPALTAFLKTYFNRTPVTISTDGEGYCRLSESTIDISGRARLFGMAEPQKVSVTLSLQHDGVLGFFLVYMLPPGWRFGHSWTELASTDLHRLFLSNGVLVLASHPFRDEGLQDAFDRGLTLAAELPLTSQWNVPEESSPETPVLIPVKGLIQVTPALKVSMTSVLKLPEFTLPVAGNPTPFFPTKMEMVYPPLPEDVGATRAVGKARVFGVETEVAVELPGLKEGVIMQPRRLADMNRSLTDWVGTVMPESQKTLLPERFSNERFATITALNVTFDPDGTTPTHFVFQAENASAEWNLVPGYDFLKLTQLKTRIETYTSIKDASGNTKVLFLAMLSGTLVMGDMAIRGTLRLSGHGVWTLLLVQDKERPVTLRKLATWIETLLPGGADSKPLSQLTGLIPSVLSDGIQLGYVSFGVNPFTPAFDHVAFEIQQATVWTVLDKVLALKDWSLQGKVAYADKKWMVSGVLQGTLVLGSGESALELDVSLAVPGNERGWVLSLAEREPIYIPTVGRMLTLLGRDDLNALLPQGLKDFGNLALSNFKVGVHPSQGLMLLEWTFYSLYDSPDNAWKVVPGLIHVYDIYCAFSLEKSDGTYGVTGRLSGMLVLFEKVMVRLSCEREDRDEPWVLTGEMIPGKDLSFKALMTQYFKQTEGLPEISLAELKTTIVPQEPSFSLDVTLTELWAIEVVQGVTVSLDEVAGRIAYSSKLANRFAGSFIKAAMTIDTATVQVKASAPDENNGWLFSIELQPLEESLDVTGLAEKLIGTTFPKEFPRLTVETLKGDVGVGPFSMNLIAKATAKTTLSGFTFTVSGDADVSYSKAKGFGGSVTGDISLVAPDEKVLLAFTNTLDFTSRVASLRLKQAANLREFLTAFGLALPEYCPNVQVTALTGSLDFSDSPFVAFDGTVALAEPFHIGPNLVLKTGSVRLEFTIGKAVRKVTLTVKASGTLGTSLVVDDVTITFMLTQSDWKLDGQLKGVFFTTSVDGSMKVDSKTGTLTLSLDTDLRLINLEQALEFRLKGGAFSLTDDPQTKGKKWVFTAKGELAAPAVFDPLTGTVGLYGDSKRTALMMSLSQNGKELGAAVFMMMKSVSGANAVVAGIRLKDGISIADLPVVGKMAAGLTIVQFEQMGVMAATEKVENVVWPDKASADSAATTVEKGVTFRGGLILGGQFRSGVVLLPVYRPKPKMLAAEAGAAAPPAMTWISVQKAVGPIRIYKLGFAFGDGTLELGVDGGLVTTALSVELYGLGARVPLKNPKALTPRLDGLYVSYKGGAAIVSGGFLRRWNEAQKAYSYVGEATIMVNRYGVSAMGGYSEASGIPSFFFFGYLGAPIGHPAIQISGIAAGFGLNRSVALPAIDRIRYFPMLQAILGKIEDPNKPEGYLTSIDTYFPPALGNAWVAVGLKGTLGQTLNVYLLAVLAIGTKPSITVVGGGSLSLPPGQSPGPTTPIYLELLMMGTVDLGRGLLAMGGTFGPSSYIIMSSCRLTGGFTYMIYLYGPHAGQFLLSIGGFNRNVPVPDYYPVLEPIGVNWAVAANLVLKGYVYFALTPSCVMFGGRFEALAAYESLFKVHLVIAFDVIVGWLPFVYEVDARVSAVVTASIDNPATNQPLSFEVSASLKLTGPPFYGQAEIRTPLFSVSLPFGEKPAPKEDEFATWDEFKALLNTKPQTMVAAANAETEADMLSLSIVAGIQKELRNKNDGSSAGPLSCLVFGDDLSIEMTSKIPAVSAQVNGVAQPVTWNTGAGIMPMGLQAADWTSALTVSVQRKDGTPLVVQWRSTPVKGNVPKALWNNGKLTAKDVLDCMVADTLTGWGLALANMPPAHTITVPLAYLIRSRIEKSVSLPPVPQPPEAHQHDKDDPATVFSQAMAADVVQKRARLCDALRRRDATLPQTVSLERLAQSRGSHFSARPILAKLGEERHVSAL